MDELEKQQNEKINPILSLWFHPKKTIRHVLHHKNLFYVNLLLVISYLPMLISFYSYRDIFPYFSLWMILLIIFTPFIAIAITSFSALVIWLIGKLFHGVGTFKEIYKATALPCWPNIIFIPYSLLWMLVHPNSFFNRVAYPFGIFSIIEFLLGIVLIIWMFIITIAMIAETHRISNLKAFLTIFIPTIAILLIIFIMIIFIVIVKLSTMG